MEREFRDDLFNDGIAKKAIREHIGDAYSRMSADFDRKKREADNDSWIRAGDKNVVRSTSLPQTPPQKPRK